MKRREREAAAGARAEVRAVPRFGREAGEEAGEAPRARLAEAAPVRGGTGPPARSSAVA